MKKEGKRKKKKKDSFFFPVIYLAHIHAISNLTADWTNSTEGSLKRRRMKLGIPSALKSTAVSGRILCIELPPNTSHRLFLCRRKGKNLAAHSAKWAMVIIQNSLVTVFVTDVCDSCKFAAIHVPANMFIVTFPVAFVTRDWPISAQNTWQKNNICRPCYHTFSIYLHCLLLRSCSFWTLLRLPLSDAFHQRLCTAQHNTENGQIPASGSGESVVSCNFPLSSNKFLDLLTSKQWSESNPSFLRSTTETIKFKQYTAKLWLSQYFSTNRAIPGHKQKLRRDHRADLS